MTNLKKKKKKTTTRQYEIFLGLLSASEADFPVMFSHVYYCGG